MTTSPGPLALVGSGEYLPVMQDIESDLIKGRSPKYVQIATAAVPDGDEVVAKWERLGIEQAQRIGVEPVTITIRDRDEANDPAVVRKLDGAGLIYFSGGDPGFLADTVRDTLFITRISELWREGSALAGCSAGAMAMTGWIPSLRHPVRGGTEGFGLLPHLRVLPHFDKFPKWIPDVVSRIMRDLPDGVTVLGIDEETALVGGPNQWQVVGRGSVWILNRGDREQFIAGSSISTK
jgi:cyanophycinase